jgi:chemotaxis protein MotB
MPVKMSRRLSLHRRKEKQEECPTCEVGAPAWMATFADMATLLMAFFVLILSFASVNVPKFEQVAGSVKLAFGVDRVVPRIMIPKAETVLDSTFTLSDAAPTVLPKKLSPFKTQHETTSSK